MSGIATTVISGNLTRDPELNQSGKVLSFAVAVNRREKSTDGEYADRAHYFDVRVLGNRAAGLSGILEKGRGVTVLGDIVQDRWETDGQRRTAVRILAREVVLHSGGGEKPKPKPQADPEIPF